ncbi:MAG: hypothetical protein GVY08_13470 [Bacteroidetes bacterium]|jgi:hypothetical protein|nr:hypothetical protein [Bacteroidota bacterium]
MRKSILIIIATFLLSVILIPKHATAQNYSSNSVYVELLGNGFFYSINYDHRFTNHFGGRMGFMIIEGQSEQSTDDQISFAILPVMANYLVGSGSHRLELGAGLQFVLAGGTLENYGSFSGGGIGGVTTTFGYRYQPVDGGFLFRIGATPFYSDGRPQLSGGLSLGYAF